MEHQINGVATSIRNKLGSLDVSHRLSHHCIYKVPEHIRKEKEECYRPSIISIGPIYYGDPSLQAMQELKLMHLKCFLQQGNNAYNVEHYINVIHGWEEEARSYYAEKISLSSNEFIEMILVDATFLIYLFMLSSSHVFLEKQPVEGNVQMLLYLEKDLCLEENQVPFFILKGLYDLAFGKIYPFTSFIDVTSVFISYGCFRGRMTPNTTICDNILGASKINHIVDLLRIAGLPSNLRGHALNKNQDYPQFPLSVTELSAVGVKFMATKCKIFDIRFVDGALQIPTFTIRETAEAVFRSIIFYEQCHYFHDSYFIDYIYFLHKLIKTPGDVQILVKNGIIDNWLGSEEEVVKLFHVIVKQIVLYLPNFYYSDVSRDLNSFANTSWNRWKTVLRRDYFNHPWSCISVIYAVVLLILTLLQTICSSFTCKI
ncbi:UPF0481 protein At3g47200 [Beta vulgaris subsp. vulgaris]|uniref:UPF0481 protein At3g47200 n=1 Tax=Beta vulgaris subsp. vulgaris TaxID=3555 RepID=UPI0020369AF5|nr:UPF0481 protein At3g47200 [Beta vulgaris subsp. vulgaris]